jgi:hypothetical protein
LKWEQQPAELVVIVMVLRKPCLRPQDVPAALGSNAQEQENHEFIMHGP